MQWLSISGTQVNVQIRSVRMSFFPCPLSIVISILISDLTDKKEETQEQLNNQRQLNQKTAEKFEEGLRELKKFEIDESFQVNGNRKLIDLYHNESEMRKYHEKCKAVQNSISLKFDSLNDDAKKIKGKIKNQKEKTKSLVKKWSETEKKLEKELKSLNDGFDELLNKFCKDYLSLRENIESIKGEGADKCLVLLGNYEQIASNFYQYDQSFLKLEGQLLLFNNEIQRLTSINIDNENVLKDNVKVFENFETYIHKINANLEKISKEELNKLEKDFSYLLKPSLLKGAYFNLIKEISRRRSVILDVKEKINIIGQTIVKENKDRSDFLNKNGNILPDKFCHLLPTLKDSLLFEGTFNDDELKKLPMINLQNFEKENALLGVNTKSNTAIDSNEQKNMEKLFGLLNSSAESANKMDISQFEELANSNETLRGFLKNMLIANTKHILRSIGQNCGFLNADENIKQLKEELRQQEESQKILQNEYDNECDNNLKLLEDLKDLRINLDDNKIRISTLEELIQEREERIQLLKEEREDIEERYENEISQLKFSKNNMRSVIADYEYKIERKDKIIKEFGKFISKGIDRMNLIANRSNKMLELELKVTEVKTKLEELQSTCSMSTLKDPFPHHIKEGFDSQNWDSDIQTKESDGLKNSIENLQIEIKELLLKNDLLNQNTQSKMLEIDSLKAKNEELSQELKESRQFSDNLLNTLEVKKKQSAEISYSLKTDTESVTLLFIPFNKDIYVPLIQENAQFIMDTDDKKLSYVLCLSSLERKHKLILEGNQFIVMARVSSDFKESNIDYSGNEIKIKKVEIESITGIFTFDQDSFNLYNLIKD